jgi:regulator of protease activity HflC (stomatin/prohibitin superfamily)
MLRFVKTATTGIRQTFGKFTGTCPPGLHFYIPIIQQITSVNNMTQNKNFVFNVKTQDNVFANIHIGVQIKIDPEDSERAFFSLSNPDEQIDSYIQNVVRSEATKMTLDGLFESQTQIANAVSKNLKEKMSTYGYSIIDTLVNDIVPDTKVAESMNKINASERLKQAAKNEADANYITKVRDAEADRDRKILQGEGISGQRLAILKGYKTSVETMSKDFSLSPKDVINFVMRTQHLDTIEAIGKSQNCKTIFLNHQSEGSFSGLANSIMQANENNTATTSTALVNIPTKKS